MFYISSQGHSASGWLAKALNKHRRIVCWHGTRSMPPQTSGINDMHPKDYIDSLKLCETHTFNEKIFGSCHGFYGTECKKYIESYNGQFFAIIRNPIDRISSIFNAYFSTNISNGKISPLENFDINFQNIFENYQNDINKIFNFELLKRNKKKENTLKVKNFVNKYNIKFHRKINRQIKIVKNSFNPLILNDNNNADKKEINIDNFLSKKNLSLIIVNTFLDACDRTFETDSEIFSETSKDQIFKMEELVKSKDYIQKNFFDKIGIAHDSIYLDSIYEDKDRIHLHSNKTSIKYCINYWPITMKDYFIDKFENCIAYDLYKHYEYRNIN